MANRPLYIFKVPAYKPFTIKGIEVLELRRIQETGGGTVLVSLPKGWAERVGVKKGAVVAMSEREDGSILVDPRYGVEQAPKTAVISPTKNVRREITSRYLLGYDIIQVTTKERIHPNLRDDIKNAVRRLVGLEIIEENARSMTIQCLLEPSGFPPERILRREYLIAGGMHRDAISSLEEEDEHLAKMVAERDEEVDRLYFLLVRLLRAIIQNPRLGDSIGLSPLDCLDYRLVASFVEAIGDGSAEVAQALHGKGQVSLPKDFVSKLKAVSDEIYSMHEGAMRAFFTRNLSLAEEIIDKKDSIDRSLQSLAGLISGESQKALTLSSIVLGSLDRIVDHAIDIADSLTPK